MADDDEFVPGNMTSSVGDALDAVCDSIPDAARNMYYEPNSVLYLAFLAVISMVRSSYIHTTSPPPPRPPHPSVVAVSLPGRSPLSVCRKHHPYHPHCCCHPTRTHHLLLTIRHPQPTRPRRSPTAAAAVANIITTTVTHHSSSLSNLPPTTHHPPPTNRRRSPTASGPGSTHVLKRSSASCSVASARRVICSAPASSRGTSCGPWRIRPSTTSHPSRSG